MPKNTPAVWLIVLIAGLPQLSETVYTPALPEMARALHASAAMVEYTLTTYLLGFALGVLFWGRFSDQWGRKPCVLVGLGVFIVGCLSCYFSSTIESLMIGRFIQAVGGSVGVMGQTICRDAFQGPALGRAYSSVASALALFPIFGPLMGGALTQYLYWTDIFLFLGGAALLLGAFVALKLPETHLQRYPVLGLQVVRSLVSDREVLGFALIMGACGGVLFSYFAEGPFCLINLLGLSPSLYGATFVAIGGATMLGGVVSKRWHATASSRTIMKRGLWAIAGGSLFLSLAAALYHVFAPETPWLMIGTILLSHMGISFGICVASSQALALALIRYRHCIGVATSLFGFFYYGLISVFTFGMGWLHNGTLLPMPLYFLGLSLMMLAVERRIPEDLREGSFFFR